MRTCTQEDGRTDKQDRQRGRQAGRQADIQHTLTGITFLYIVLDFIPFVTYLNTCMHTYMHTYLNMYIHSIPFRCISFHSIHT